MANCTITFFVPEEKLQALDSVAAVRQQDRGSLLNEAVAQFLSLHDYHRGLIEEGLRQDDAGEVIDHAAVRSMAAAWSEAPADGVPEGR